MSEETTGYRGRPLLFSLLLLALALLLTTGHILQRWNFTIYDLFSGALARPAAEDIVILAVDEHSLAKLGRWPWSRSVHAKLIDKISRGGAKVIGLDIIFAETAPDSRQDDALLAEAIRKNGLVILPLVNETSRINGPLKLTRPLPQLADAAAGFGHVDVELDSDGIVRHAFLKAGHGKADLPAFSLAMLMLTTPDIAHHIPGRRNPNPAAAPPDSWVRDYQILIPFAGPPGHFRCISCADFLDPSFDVSAIQDAYVLVGVTAPGLGDGLPTPVSGNMTPMPGVELNANILDTLRNDLAILPMTLPMQLGINGLLILIPFLLYPHLRARSSLTAVTVLLTVPLLSCYLFLRFLHLWYPPMVAMACIILGYLLWTWRRLEWTVAELAREKQQALVTLHSIGDGVISIDSTGRVRFMNPMAELLTAFTSGEAYNHLLQDIIQLTDEHHGRDLMPLISHCLQARQPATIQADARCVNRDGRELTVHVSAGSIHDEEGDNTGVVLGITDLTATRSMAEQLAFQATHDPLTGLPNRTLLKDRLAQAIGRTQRSDLQVAILHVNLDSFKKINNMLGHKGADQLLQETAVRLQNVNKGELTVTRLGADEFVILLENMDSTLQAEQVAEKLLTTLQVPFSIQGQQIKLTASIGISLFPQDGDHVEDLIKNAAIAMYQVKETGKNASLFFSSKMHDWIQERLNLEKELRSAVDGNQLELYYQPQIRLSDGRLMGVEALLRWQTTDGRYISPARFIPIAEESDLILSIGRWVLEKACRQAKKWQDAGFEPITMAVNISPKQFLQKDYLDLIVRILKETGMSARYLELEITENTIIQHLEHSSYFIKGFRELGGTISIDDFGTGYSSLSYLKQFPVDHLKIDRFFVRDIAVAPEDAAITKAVITMAHGLDLSVVAEGVETQAQLSTLLDQECDKVQGYLLAHPMSAEEMTSLLATGGSCTAYPIKKRGRKGDVTDNAETPPAS